MSDDFVHHIELSSDDFETEDLKIRRLSGREAVSELYAIEVEVTGINEDQAIATAEETIDATVMLELCAEDATVLRRVHGVVSWARYRGGDQGQHGVLELRIVPRLWRLTLFRTQELFLKKSVPDIIAEKLERIGLGNYATINLVRDYPARELVVQYQESDYEFVCRLCEHLGIAFFFVHDEDEERIVFTDHDGGWQPADAALPYGAGGEQVGVSAMSTEAAGVPRVFAVKDYNYRTPDVDLASVAQLEQGLPGGIIEYGSHHRTPDDATTMAQVRMEAAACRRVTHAGTSTVSSIQPGTFIEMDGHVGYEEGTLRVVSVEHEAEFADGFAEGQHVAYHNRFVTYPGELAFRPERKTSRPHIPGIVSAIVQPGGQGDVGGIPRIDDDGRYYIRFHFDGTAYGAQPASQAVRMAQPFVGEGSNGMHFPLQRGTEVLVAFIDGNPDRPIIVSAVPNAVNPATIVARESGLNKIQTAQGVTIEFGSNQ
jgi:type VI secretion system secreted protein VgrG